MIASQCVPFVLRESYTLNVLQSRMHGLDHWFRVWQNALFLAGPEQPNLEVVALYALFHDSMRANDGEDPDHGTRGFELWKRFNRLHEVEQYLTSRQREILFEACVDHSSGRRSYDPTIAICWDADRMDLHRKGISPLPIFMSTPEGIDLMVNRLVGSKRRKT